MTPYEIVAAGDACLSVEFENKIEPEINARCIAFATWMAKQNVSGVRDVVPAFRNVAVYYDPLVADRAELRATIAQGVAGLTLSPVEHVTRLEIRVQYGGEAGPDLPAVAAYAGCSESDVVDMHTSVIYRVYMLGFLPGFPYMGTVNSRIGMPRLDTPRLKVAAGSVGIARTQTGIYPFDSPGGWRIIGRTSTRLYDPSSETPFLFRPGQAVKFVAE